MASTLCRSLELRDNATQHGRLGLRCAHGSQLQIQELAGVFEANIAYHRAQEVFIIREFTVFNVAAEEVAQDAAEVLVAGGGTKSGRGGERARGNRGKSAVW